MKTNTNEERVLRVLERINNNEITYKRETTTFTIEKIIKMVKKGTLQLAEEQRNFVAKANVSNGIVFSIISGRGITNITVNYKNGIYYIIDGCQRLTSLLLYVTGATVDEWKNKVFVRPANKKVTTLTVKGIDEDDELYEEYEEMAEIFNKKAFSDLPKSIKEKVLSMEIGFVVYDNLPKNKEIQLFIDLNKGSTSLSKMGLVKANCNPYLWNKICSFAKEQNYPLSNKNRFSSEKFVAELMTEFINSAFYALEEKDVIVASQWIDAVNEFVKRYNKQTEEIIDEIFDNFKISINAFNESHLNVLANLEKDRARTRFDTVTYKAIYKMFVNYFYNEEETIYKSIIDIVSKLLNGDGYTKKHEFRGILYSYKDLCIQGTGTIQNTDYCESILIDELKKENISFLDKELIRQLRIAQKNPDNNINRIISAKF